jgi:hypothetical protein
MISCQHTKPCYKYATSISVPLPFVPGNCTSARVAKAKFYTRSAGCSLLNNSDEVVRVSSLEHTIHGGLAPPAFKKAGNRITKAEIINYVPLQYRTMGFAYKIADDGAVYAATLKGEKL